ncbi:hypothetical protein P6F26_11620 [Roseibacterium sp. SDUM158017]|uniref:hypothetical protein n=1 Tax=Roseicyclus salinarum TaxID=3036773 RepID=UPI002415957B|nr:hypothetical protein [Roseibacterium sp. SDUM158017]MDG4649095.1 hypothetical protein [Roseibacterium sp. SDUM158017]
MRYASLRRTASACLVACSLAAPAPAAADAGPALDYLARASDDVAADYLAFLIRSWGCEVRRADRADFSAAIVEFIALDFGIDLSDANARAASEDLDAGLFAFSFRAGPLLMERGELRIDDEGTARLTTCNTLTS